MAIYENEGHSVDKLEYLNLHHGKHHHRTYIEHVSERQWETGIAPYFWERRR